MAQERSASAADLPCGPAAGVPPGPMSGVPVAGSRGPAARVTSSAVSGSISARSSLPATSSETRSSRGTARSTISSSFAGSPHQRGLPVRTTWSPLVSTFLTAKGPALTLRARRAPSLKASGVPVTSFGYRGVNRAFQSA